MQHTIHDLLLIMSKNRNIRLKKMLIRTKIQMLILQKHRCLFYKNTKAKKSECTFASFASLAYMLDEIQLLC